MASFTPVVITDRDNINEIELLDGQIIIKAKSGGVDMTGIEFDTEIDSSLTRIAVKGDEIFKGMSGVRNDATSNEPTVTNYYKYTLNYNSYENGVVTEKSIVMPDSKYMSYTGTLSSSNQTIVVFTNSIITNNSIIEVSAITSEGIILKPYNVSMSVGTCAVTFSAYQDVDFVCNLYISEAQATESLIFDESITSSSAYTLQQDDINELFSNKPLNFTTYRDSSWNSPYIPSNGEVNNGWMYGTYIENLYESYNTDKIFWVNHAIQDNANADRVILDPNNCIKNSYDSGYSYKLYATQSTYNSTDFCNEIYYPLNRIYNCEVLKITVAADINGWGDNKKVMFRIGTMSVTGTKSIRMVYTNLTLSETGYHTYYISLKGINELVGYVDYLYFWSLHSYNVSIVNIEITKENRETYLLRYDGDDDTFGFNNAKITKNYAYFTDKKNVTNRNNVSKYTNIIYEYRVKSSISDVYFAFIHGRGNTSNWLVMVSENPFEIEVYDPTNSTSTTIITSESITYENETYYVTDASGGDYDSLGEFITAPSSDFISFTTSWNIDWEYAWDLCRKIKNGTLINIT